jgi:hypothetical protein
MGAPDAMPVGQRTAQKVTAIIAVPSESASCGRLIFRGLDVEIKSLWLDRQAIDLLVILRNRAQPTEF